MAMLFDKEIQQLVKEFHVIARKKWIKSVDKGLGSIGYTFENELGKQPDSLYFPDYYGTEIKCTGRYSRYPITLFTAAFDGPTFPEINRVIDMYGYFDKKHLDKKVIFANLDCKCECYIASGYYLKLDIDNKEEKIYLCVYDIKRQFVERERFVYVTTLYDHVMVKLERLALVYASKKKFDNETFFRYYKIIVGKLRGFDVFLELIRVGIIKVDLIVRVSKSGIDEGRYRNKNLVFKIKKDNIDKLFEILYVYDYDFNINSI